MTNNDTLMTFPCDFTLKIIGVASSHYVSDISTIIFKHFPQTSSNNIISKDSGQGNYIAITATVHALNQADLDALYQDLTQYPGIKMVL